MPKGQQKNRRGDSVRNKRMRDVLESVREGARVMEACKAAGITRWVFYDWKRRYPEFAAEAVAAQETAISVVEDALYTGAVNGNITAQIFFLCNRAKDRWMNVQSINHQHSGPGGSPIQVTAAATLLSGLNDGQLEDIIKRGKPNAAPVAPGNGPTPA